MKKTAMLLILLFIISLSLVTIKTFTHVSGNTFTMPQDNKENNQYHTYNIKNNQHKPANNKTDNKNSKDSNTDRQTTNKNQQSFSQETNSTYNNVADSPAAKIYNKPLNNNYRNIKNNIKKNKSTPKPETAHIPKVKTTPAAKSTTFPDRQKTSRKKTYRKKTENTITKIEFKKHFIKIAAGSCEDILFTTVPAKNTGLNFIYKSMDNSIASFKNKKLTGIKQGFTTILIMLPDNTIKAACPVKII